MKKRILCVDDHDETCLMLEALLGPAGYELKSAAGFSEGLKLAGSESFDLYILDQRLVDGTGVELCHRIRELHPQAPIMFFSGMAHESDKRDELDAGAQEYLVKPNDIGKLIQTVMRLIRNENG